jgi:hypothetical protein
VVVDFDPETAAAEKLCLRYEYRAALAALGVLPVSHPDRLLERDAGERGFAQPPLW